MLTSTHTRVFRNTAGAMVSQGPWWERRLNGVTGSSGQLGSSGEPRGLPWWEWCPPEPALPSSSV